MKEAEREVKGRGRERGKQEGKQREESELETNKDTQRGWVAEPQAGSPRRQGGPEGDEVQPVLLSPCSSLPCACGATDSRCAHRHMEHMCAQACVCIHDTYTLCTIVHFDFSLFCASTLFLFQLNEKHRLSLWGSSFQVSQGRVSLR